LIASRLINIDACESTIDEDIIIENGRARVRLIDVSSNFCQSSMIYRKRLRDDATDRDREKERERERGLPRSRGGYARSSAAHASTMDSFSLFSAHERNGISSEGSSDRHRTL